MIRSKQDVKDFMVNPVWLQIIEELQARLEENHEMMEVAPIDNEFGDEVDGGGRKRKVLERVGVKNLQGQNMAIRAFLDYPQRMLEELESEETSNART